MQKVQIKAKRVCEEYVFVLRLIGKIEIFWEEERPEERYGMFF